MNKNKMKFASLAIVSAALAVPALATDPTPGDYSTAIGTFSTAMGTALTTNLPSILGVLVIFLSLGVAWKLLKRGAKSV